MADKDGRGRPAEEFGVESAAVADHHEAGAPPLTGAGRARLSGGPA
ncbi:hypothetical protein ABZU75_42555 [Streptosporangium sp. NPDC005286]